MTKINTNKTINENYPSLKFDAAKDSNINLYDTEDLIKGLLISKFKNYIFIWEYGNYFVSYFVSRTSIDNFESPIAALFTECVSALRASFLVSLQGYHPEAITLLRRVHESLIRALAIKKNPTNIWNITNASDIRRAERSIGINLDKLYNLESSFSHSNKLKIFQIGVDIHAGKDVEVRYGPQINEKEFALTSKISIFWLYTLIKSATKLFPDRPDDYWISRQHESAKLMRDYLHESKSGLVKDCDQIDKSLNSKRAKSSQQGG